MLRSVILHIHLLDVRWHESPDQTAWFSATGRRAEDPVLLNMCSEYFFGS